MAHDQKETDSKIKTPASVWSVEYIQKCLQIISVLAAAVWSLWLFFTYDKASKSLAIEKSKLELDQMKTLTRVEQEARLLSIKQQKLGIDQQDLTLKQQKLAASIQDRQQIYNLEQQRLGIEQQNLSIQISGVDKKTREVQLGALVQTPIEQSYDLNIHRAPGKDSIYIVNLSISITNKSQKEININAAELSGYIGSLKFPDEKYKIKMINLPSDEGSVAWGQYFQYPYISIESSGMEVGQKDAFGRVVGGLAYGRLSTGETMRSSRKFFIFSDDPNRWFGYSLTIHTSERGRRDWQYVYDGFAQLNEADSPKQVQK